MSTLKVNTIQDTATNNAMTISGGVVTFPNKPSGTTSLELIASDTTGGSGATIEFDLSTNTKYFSQKLIIWGVYRTDGSDGDLYGSARNDADNSYIGSGYYTSVVGYHSQGSGGRTNSNAGDWNATYFRIGGYNIGDSAEHEDNVWEFDFYNSIGTTKRMSYIGRRIGHSSDATLAVETFGGRLLHTAQIDRFKLENGSGATTGYAGYQLYGLLKA